MLRLSLLITVLVLLPEVNYSQDSASVRSQKRFYHLIGFGPQWFNNRSISRGHGTCDINYVSPLYHGFYRFEYVNAKQGRFCITLDFNYREGHGYDGGHSAISYGVTSQGDFKALRGIISPVYMWAMGRKRAFFFGTGLNLGYLLFASGTSSEDFNDGFANEHRQEVVNSGELLDKITLGAYIEFQQEFRIRKNAKFLIGTKLGVDSGEGYNSTIGAYAAPYIGLRI